MDAPLLLAASAASRRPGPDPGGEVPGGTRPVGSRDPDAKRSSIMQLVSAKPGIHKSLLCRRLGLSWSTASYHIRRLRKSGQLVVQESSREVRLFVPGIAPRQASWLRHLHNDVDVAILGHLSETAGLRTHEISAALGVSERVIRRHLAHLTQVGLVVQEGNYGRRFRPAADAGGATNLPVQVGDLDLAEALPEHATRPRMA